MIQGVVIRVGGLTQIAEPRLSCLSSASSFSASAVSTGVANALGEPFFPVSRAGLSRLCGWC